MDFGNILLTLAAYGFWDILSLLLLAAGAMWGYVRFFRPVRSIPNFTVFFNYCRDLGHQYQSLLTIELRNHTGHSVHIMSAGFKCEGLRPHPDGTRDAGTGKLEIKFSQSLIKQPGTSQSVLSTFEAFLTDGQSMATWAPLDPTHSDDDVRYAMQLGTVGYFECYVTLISKNHKPLTYRLIARPKTNFGIKRGIISWLKVKFLSP